MNRRRRTWRKLKKKYTQRFGVRYEPIPKLISYGRWSSSEKQIQSIPREWKKEYSWEIVDNGGGV